MEIPKFGEICMRRHCDKNSTLNSNRETCDCTYNTTTTTKELYNIRGSSHCEMENTTEVRMEKFETAPRNMVRADYEAERKKDIGTARRQRPHQQQFG
jgi:hypothetical protein